MSEYPNRPRVKMAEVREYTSANGKQYFSFYLGKAKLLLFRDDRAEPPGNATGVWNLYAEEAEPKPQHSPASGPQRPAWQPRPQQSATSSRSATERQKNRTAQDARAEASLRERGINPDSKIVDDDIGL
jgi:hypothetical protein